MNNCEHLFMLKDTNFIPDPPICESICVKCHKIIFRTYFDSRTPDKDGQIDQEWFAQEDGGRMKIQIRIVDSNKQLKEWTVEYADDGMNYEVINMMAEKVRRTLLSTFEEKLKADYFSQVFAGAGDQKDGEE